MTIRCAGITSNDETDNGRCDRQACDEPDESPPDYQSTRLLDERAGEDADTCIDVAAICIAASGSSSLPDHLAVPDRGDADRLAEHPSRMTAAVPTDPSHRLLDWQVGLTQ